MNEKSVPAWKPLLIAYLNGDEFALTPLFRAAKKPMVNIVRRLAPAMPDDLREDVVQQLFLRLLESRPKYDPFAASVTTLTFGLLRNAIRQVRSMFTPPGQKTRVVEAGTALPGSCESDLQEIEPQEEEPCANDESRAVPASDVERATSIRWTAAHTTASLLAHELLSMMPRNSAKAAWLSYGQGCSNTEIAEVTGRSRFAIARDLAAAERATCPAFIGAASDAAAASFAA